MGDERFGDPGKTTVFPHSEKDANAADPTGEGGAGAGNAHTAFPSVSVSGLSSDETDMFGARAAAARAGADATQVVSRKADETQVLGTGGQRPQAPSVDETRVLQGDATKTQADVAGAQEPGTDETQVLGAGQPQVLGAGETRVQQAVPDAAFSPRGHIPERAVNPQMMPDSAFEPRSAAYSGPSATSVMPADLIAERRRRNQRDAGRGARFAAGSFAQEEPPAARQGYAQQEWEQPAYAPQAGYGQPVYAQPQPAPEKKRHGCLVAFITVLVVLVILGAAAIFALDYAVQQTGVPKEEILSRIAKPVQDFIDGLKSR